MRFQKQVLGRLEKCYAVSTARIGGRMRVFYASEAENGSCLAFDPATGDCEPVWEGPGGCMSILPLPGQEDTLLAIQGFYPPFLATGSRLVMITRKQGGYHVRTLLELPYLHRFGLVETDEALWVVCATLCAQKSHRDDWTHPGSVYAARLIGHEVGPLEELCGGLSRNHGFHQAKLEGREAILIGADQGVWAFFPPQKGGAWRGEHLFDGPVSDLAAADLKGDGTPELIVLSPFHGGCVTVRNLGGEVLWTLPRELAFAHALWADEFGVLIGHRRGEGELLLLTWEDGAYRTRVVGDGGPSNVCTATLDGKPQIFAANHSSGECVRYLIDP